MSPTGPSGLKFGRSIRCLGDELLHFRYSVYPESPVLNCGGGGVPPTCRDAKVGCINQVNS